MPGVKLSLKKEVKHYSSSSSDDSSSSSGENDTKHREKLVKNVKTMKRKRTSESSIIGESLSKIRKLCKDESDLSSSSVSSNEIGSKNKFSDLSKGDSSFASPGLSSTKISSKTAKSKTKDCGTNEFLKKMMSRFDK